MNHWKTLISRRCCGGPIVLLSLAFFLFGALFSVLSAIGLGMVFVAVGAAAFGMCLWLAQSRCPQMGNPLHN